LSPTGLASIRRKVRVACYQLINITDQEQPQSLAETTVVVSKSYGVVARLNADSHNEGHDLFAHHVKLAVHHVRTQE
jgi:hypothetical protein